MPEFKIKNLMVDVVSGAHVPDLDKLCLWPTPHGCFPRTCFKFISPPWCHMRPFTCPIHSIDPCDLIRTTIIDWERPVVCGNTELVVIDLRKLAVNPEVIKEVQAELDQVLKAVAERGVEINKAMAPQTKAQAEVLETELKAALEEVQKLKGAMK